MVAIVADGRSADKDFRWCCTCLNEFDDLLCDQPATATDPLFLLITPAFICNRFTSEVYYCIVIVEVTQLIKGLDIMKVVLVQVA